MSGNPNLTCIKEGRLYDDIKKDIKPLDLILFKGGEFVSDLIRFFEYTRLDNNWANDYSHCGLIVTKELLDDPRLEDGKLYVWESTMSGKLDGGVYNIDGKAFLGVQLRNFDDVINSYDAPATTAIAWCRLKNNPFLDDTKKEDVKKQFAECFKTYNGIRYDLNFYSLFSALYKYLRFLRKPIEKILHTEKWIFCSELPVLVYKALGLLDASVNEKNVLPVDFITKVDSDHAIPDYFVSFPIRITIKQHYDSQTVTDNVI